MLKNTVLAILIIILAACITFGTERYLKNNRGDFFILEQGATVPDFAFKTMDGRAHRLYDFRGRISIVHFWASWCAPCVVEFPELVVLAKNNPESMIIAVSSDRTSAAIERFLSSHAPDLPENFLIIHDVHGAITKDKFSVFKLPESFVIDKAGVLESHIVGAYKGWESFVQ